MHKIDPNEVDALFRDGADQHEFVYNPAAWDLMEDKLNKRDRRKTFLWFFLGLIVVAGSIYGYVHFNNNSTPKTPQQVITSDISTPQKLKEKTNTAQSFNTSEGTELEQTEHNISQTATNNSSIAERTADQTRSEEIKEEYINTGSEVRSRNIGAQISENTGSLVSNEVVSVAPTNVSEYYNTENNANSIDENSSVFSSINDRAASSDKSNLSSRDQEALALLNINKTTGIFSLNHPILDFDLTPNVISKEKVAIPSTSRYVFTGYANADFSSVGIFKKSRAGFKVGFKIGKQFSDKFQFDLGLAYSHKKYGAVGEEYTRDAGWGVDDIKPTWMDAKCDVLEIPLEISYYLNGFKNDGFFINAGISSYLVNSEWYGFKFDEIGMEQEVRDLLVKEINPDEITNMNYHLSGVGKLSIGYQKIVSPNMAIEVSPYIQIPLTGIGEGKVNLYSTGIQFALKFNSK